MRKIKLLAALTMLVFLAGGYSFSQDSQTDSVTVPFSDPGKPGLVKAHVITGSIMVKGYTGNEVIVEAKSRLRKVTNKKKLSMKLINQSGGTGLTIEEKDNVMEISARSYNKGVDLSIQVPVAVSLKISTINGGDIIVENINGEVIAKNTNGKIKLSNISGTALANTVNGSVTVTFDRIDADKPMSFTTMNGDVDVTFPAGLKANLKMKSERGEIYSDFEIAIVKTQPKATEGKRDESGKYRISFDKSLMGTVLRRRFFFRTGIPDSVGIFFLSL